MCSPQNNNLTKNVLADHPERSQDKCYSLIQLHAANIGGDPHTFGECKNGNRVLGCCNKQMNDSLLLQSE